MQPCCTRDEGWPLGFGLQGQNPNHHERRRFNDRGRERRWKRRAELVRCARGRRTQVNRRRRVEKYQTPSKPGSRSWPGTEARREPADGPSGGRHTDGVSLAQACVWNVGTCRFDAKGNTRSGGPTSVRVPMRGGGTDRLVVAGKPGNAGGAKEPASLDVRNWSPRKGRSRCLTPNRM